MNLLQLEDLEHQIFNRLLCCCAICGSKRLTTSEKADQLYEEEKRLREMFRRLREALENDQG